MTSTSSLVLLGITARCESTARMHNFIVLKWPETTLWLFFINPQKIPFPSVLKLNGSHGVPCRQGWTFLCSKRRQLWDWRKGYLLQSIKNSIHNVVVMSTELFDNESIMEINPTVHLIQEKMRKQLYYSLERAGTTSGSSVRYPQRFQLPLLPARGTNSKMELMLPCILTLTFAELCKGSCFAVYQT